MENIGFKIYTYNQCVANKMVKGHQNTVIWRVDDIKSSHVSHKINDEFLEWLKKMYGEDGIGKVKATREKERDYLGMKLIYTQSGKLEVDMRDYIQETIKEFPDELNGKSNTP